MIRDLYQQLDDMGKPVKGGYEGVSGGGSLPKKRPGGSLAGIQAEAMHPEKKYDFGTKAKPLSEQEGVLTGAGKRPSPTVGPISTGPLADIDLDGQEEPKPKQAAKPKPEKKETFAEAAKKAGWPSSVGSAGSGTLGEQPKAKKEESTGSITDDHIKQLAKANKLPFEMMKQMVESNPGLRAQIEQHLKKTVDATPKTVDATPKTVDATPKPGTTPPALPATPPTPPPLPEKEVPIPPPVENVARDELAISPENYLTNYGERARGQDARLEDHLAKSGVFAGATPDQLSRFADMLGIPQARFITTPDQLRGAILLNNAQPRLMQVLTQAGILGTAPDPTQEPSQPTGLGRFGRAVSDFAQGYADKSGLSTANNIRRAITRAMTQGRFSATAEADQIQAARKAWKDMTPSERAIYDDEEHYNEHIADETDRLQAKNKPVNQGIELPTTEIDNEDAADGDQLGLFEGTGQKNRKQTKFKLENGKENAKQSLMFDRMNDHPDQKSLFSSFGEAVDRYSAELKKK